MSTEQVNNIPSIMNKTQLKVNPNSPTMQGQGIEAIQNSANNNYIANRMKASEDAGAGKTLPLTIGSWYLLAQGAERLNKKYCGTYDQSLSGKIGGWADKFSQKTWVGQKLESGLQWIDRTFAKLGNKSKIINSLRKHSTQPEWKFAKTPGAGVKGFFVADAEVVCEEFLKPISGKPGTLAFGLIKTSDGNHFQKLEQYGMKQTEINAFKASLKGKSAIEKAIALQKKELELLGANPKVVASIESKAGFTGLQKFAQHLKAKKLGFPSYREFLKLKGHFLENSTKIWNYLKRGDQSINISIWRDNTSLLGKIKSHLFGRQVGVSEYTNKYTTLLGKGNKTKLGRGLPKAFAWIMEGGTNRFGGGKLGVFMQAFIFGDILYHTIKAPWKEKIKVFGERCFNDFGYFVGLTAGILGMHKIGGFKYAGLKTNRQRVLYRQKLREFNAKEAAGLLNTKAKYRNAEKILDSYLGVKNIKNPITKLLHKLGKFINMGNESKRAYRSSKIINANILRKLFNKNLVGVPVRILIPMAIVVPFVAKMGAKIAHGIFGKPTKSVLDEDKEEEQNQTQDLTPEQMEYLQKIEEMKNRKPRDPNSYQSDTNLIKMTSNGQKIKPQTPKPEEEVEKEEKPINNADTGINSDAAEIKDSNKKQNRYIPSSEPVVIEEKRDKEFEQRMKKFDRIEKQIEKTLM